MSFLAAIRLALNTLLLHKARSFLTSLGIVIGIGAVIALVAAGGGARRKLDERLESAGKNLIIVRPGARTWSGITDSAPLTVQDAEAIQERLGPLLIGAVPWQVAPELVSNRTNSCATILTGTTPAFQRVGNWRVCYGRTFTEDELRKNAPVCLVGQTVRRKLFPDRPNPVGEQIHVGHMRLTVIGVIGEKGKTPIGMDQDDQIFLPITTLQRQIVGKENIAMILATARSDNDIDRAKEGILQVMRQQHHITDATRDTFDVSSVRELAEFAVVLTATLQVLVGVIASISLIVGGIGIMNIMLVSVTERTREIGIRMAVGATRADVLIQFLIEAVVLALVGGVVGVSVGLAGAAGLARLADWPVIVSPSMILLAFVLTAAVGIFFGYYPALKASRLEPIEALRYE